MMRLRRQALYQALNEGSGVVNEFRRLKNWFRQGLLGKLPAMPVRWRVRSDMGLIAVMLALALHSVRMPHGRRCCC